MSNLGGIDPRPKSQPRTITVSGMTLLAALALLTILFLGLLSAAVVEAGHVGVLTTFGRVEPGVRYPGFHLIIPIAQQMHQVDTRVQPHPFKEIEAASREMQAVRLTGMMNYHLEPNRAADLYQNVGLDFADKVIDPAFNDFIKEVVPQYPVTRILAERDEIRAKAKEALSANLERYGIVVDDIYISNIGFSDEYQQAIEQKQTAQQYVETERQVLAQKEIQAQQKIVDARAEAEAMVVRAQGEAEANEIRSRSITPQLIDYLRWTRWDGKLPMVTSGASPLLEIKPNE